MNWFGWSSKEGNGSAYLPDSFPLGMIQNDFVRTEIVNIYTKILTDVVERTQGIPDDKVQFLWDNCVQSESPEGLVTLLACAMAEKKELCLIFKNDVLRRADGQEAQQIKADYQKSGKSALGVFVSFARYVRSDMIKLYSAMEYCTVAALNKQMNLSKATQFKISDLRASVSLADSADAKTQASVMADALSKGKDIIMDAKDVLELLKPDLTAVKESILFLDSKRCFYLGMPLSYINGELPKGLGDTGEADAKGIERGLKSYYHSIFKPVFEAVFEGKTTFKSQDFRQIDSALNALKVFELVSDEFISKDNKLLIVNKLLDVESELGEEPAPVTTNMVIPPGPNQKPPESAPKAKA